MRETETERTRLREWLMQAPALIALLSGREHRFSLASAGYQELVGSDPVGLTVAEALPEVVEQGYLELLDRVFTSGEAYVGSEMPVRFAGGNLAGREAFFNVVYQPIRDPEGIVEGIFALAVDVTDQFRARQQLEAEVAERVRAERLLTGERHVLESIARGQPLRQTLEALAGVIEAETEGALCSILLLDRDGIHLRHGAAPSLPEAYNQAIDGIAIGPSVGSCGTAAYRGEPVIVSDIATDPLWTDFRDLALAHGLQACWSTPIRRSDGQVLGTFAVYHIRPIVPRQEERRLVDVLTYLASIAIERHLGEQERGELLAREREARAAAETAVRTRDEFLSIASHELRTPVTVVKGTAQVLQRAVRLERLDQDRLSHSLDTIERAGGRLALLVDDLLDVTRLQSGRFELRRESVVLGRLIQELVRRLGETLDGSHRVTVQQSDGEVRVEADITRLEQVLDNLLGNAVKYSAAGSEIEVRIEREGDGAAVSICDHGIGLPVGAVEQVFEPFGRAANAVRRNLPGMGLGLYVSRQIAELHGGTLRAESPGEGQGTTLRLWLPAQHAS